MNATSVSTHPVVQEIDAIDQADVVRETARKCDECDQLGVRWWGIYWLCEECWRLTDLAMLREVYGKQATDAG